MFIHVIRLKQHCWQSRYHHPCHNHDHICMLYGITSNRFRFIFPGPNIRICVHGCLLDYFLFCSNFIGSPYSFMVIVAPFPLQKGCTRASNTNHLRWNCYSTKGVCCYFVMFSGTILLSSALQVKKTFTVEILFLEYCTYSNLPPLCRSYYCRGRQCESE